MKKLFQILAVAAICLLFKPVNLCYSQNDVCKKFEFVNKSANSYIPFSPLKSKKAKLESQYNFVCSYDFNGDGSAEEIYSRLDQQSAGLLLESKNDNLENYKFYIDDGMPESEDDGIWIFIVDVVGDETPEIVAFSFFRYSSICSLSIIKYDKIKNSFVQKDYGLNELVLDQHMLVKNKKVIVNSYGSQGLFDEIPFSDEDFDNKSSQMSESSQEAPKSFQFNFQNYEALPGDLEGFYTWEEAVSACDNLVAFGKSDWYLPNAHELDALYKRKDQIGGFQKNGVYWSSETDSKGIVGQNFQDGLYLHGSLDGVAMARCIRKN